MRKPFLFLISLTGILLMGLMCSCSKTDSHLDDIEKRMMASPKDAFMHLAEMDTLSMSEKQKARRALLHAYMATIYVMPVDLSAADLERATTAFEGHCDEDEVKSLIINSELAKANGQPVICLEMLKDAEFLANQINDKSGLAFIYYYLSRAYANGFNGTVAEYYANRALNLFNELGYNKQSIDARMAIVGALAVKRDYKTMLDSLLSMKKDVLKHSTESYKSYFLDQLARTLDENGQSREAVETWQRIYASDSISANTLAHWARAYIHLNKLDSAEVMINRALYQPRNPSDEYLCRNVQYDIFERLGRKSQLPMIDSLRQEAANIDYDGRHIAETSLALNKKYDSATRSAWKEIQNNRVRSIILISILVVLAWVTIGSVLFYRKRHKLLRVENENTVLKLQNLEQNLFEARKQQSAVGEKVSTLFSAPFKTIDKLAATYAECKGTPQEEKRVFAETKRVIDGLRSQDSLNKMAEIVNTANDNLMERFDEDFPKISASARRLALYLFCGFSLQTISIFQQTDIRNIYVYKSRLKSSIQKSNSPNKDAYLAYFS